MAWTSWGVSWSTSDARNREAMRTRQSLTSMSTVDRGAVAVRPDAEDLLRVFCRHLQCSIGGVPLDHLRRWRAEYWTSATRDLVITLACLWLGYPVHHAKGAHLLPDELARPLEVTLIHSPGEPELRRALAAIITVVTSEFQRSGPALAARLRPMLTARVRPMLTELAGTTHGPDLPPGHTSNHM
jgi:hypothetical protein